MNHDLLKQCKDEVAKNLGFPDWDNYFIEHKPYELLCELYSSRQREELIEAFAAHLLSAGLTAAEAKEEFPKQFRMKLLDVQQIVSALNLITLLKSFKSSMFLRLYQPERQQLTEIIDLVIELENKLSSHWYVSTINKELNEKIKEQTARSIEQQEELTKIKAAHHYCEGDYRSQSDEVKRLRTVVEEQQDRIERLAKALELCRYELYNLMSHCVDQGWIDLEDKTDGVQDFENAMGAAKSALSGEQDKEKHNDL